MPWPSTDLGREDCSSLRRRLEELADRGWVPSAFSSSIERREGPAPEETENELEDMDLWWSSSAFVDLRMRTILPMSVTAADRWLAAASRRLTGDIPMLVACVLVAVTRFPSVASVRSLRACNPSGSESG